MFTMLSAPLAVCGSRSAHVLGFELSPVHAGEPCVLHDLLEVHKTVVHGLAQQAVHEELAREWERLGLRVDHLGALNVVHRPEPVIHVSGVSLERREPEGHVVDCDAERPQVHTMVVEFSAADLRAQVSVGPNKGSRAVPWPEDFREAEVTDLEVAILRDQEVRQLDVPVDYMALVQVAQRQEQVGGVETTGLHVHQPTRRQAAAQVLARCQVHHEKQLCRRLVRVDESNEERVVQFLHDGLLAQDHAFVLGMREPVPVNDLEGETLELSRIQSSVLAVPPETLPRDNLEDPPKLPCS
mmetsp:Transcript_28314/g.82787  ORF Transcript_28314/g.82787 Transcript_28314/m.82787 type:complete len:298 (+) Transcript_28314:240-1133(+)